MIIEGNRLRQLVNFRYKSAKAYVFDAEYNALESKLIEKAYGQFIWQMKLIGLHRWIKNKLDCDKWAWLFKAYITARNALSKRKHAVPVGILCYYINGDRTRPHMINTYLHFDDGKLTATELEPQPDNGAKELTEKERDSAWLVAF